MNAGAETSPPSYEMKQIPSFRIRVPPALPASLQPPSPHVTTSNGPNITPYLCLPARLSQVWLNRATIVLVLILVRLLFAMKGMDADIAAAKDNTVLACQGTEEAMSGVASAPMFMASGLNELVAFGIEKSVDALQELLQLMITGIGEVIIFFVDLLVQTYVCLVTMAVHGALSAVIAASEKLVDFFNTAVSTIGTDIATEVDSLNQELEKARASMNGVTGFFGATTDIPVVSIPAANGLRNISFPSGIDQKLEQLNASVPTFQQVKNVTHEALMLPFRALSSELGDYKFNRSILPVPTSKAVTICSGGNDISNFYNNIATSLHKAATILVGILITAAAIAMLASAAYEYWTWRNLRAKVYVLASFRGSRDPLEIVSAVQYPLRSRLQKKLSLFFASAHAKVLAEWFIAYITHTPAVTVVALGVAGLLSCAFQLLLLKAIKEEFGPLMSAFNTLINTASLDIADDGERWRTETNTAINGTGHDLNSKMFGWVNESTSAVNDTLNSFTSGMMKTLNDSFGGTPLYDVLDCLILFKIEGVQRGLTWVSDKAQIQLPLIPDTIFAGLNSTNGTSPSNVNSTGGVVTTAFDRTNQTLVRLTNSIASKWDDSIRFEAIISGSLVLCWCLVVVFATIRIVVAILKTNGALLGRR